MSIWNPPSKSDGFAVVLAHYPVSFDFKTPRRLQLWLQAHAKSQAARWAAALWNSGPSPLFRLFQPNPAELLIIFPSKIAINLGVPHLEKRRHVHHVHSISEVWHVSLDMSGIVSGTVVVTAVVMHQLMESLCAQSQSISILESICCRRLRTWQA